MGQGSFSCPGPSAAQCWEQREASSREDVGGRGWPGVRELWREPTRSGGWAPQGSGSCGGSQQAVVGGRPPAPPSALVSGFGAGRRGRGSSPLPPPQPSVGPHPSGPQITSPRVVPRPLPTEAQMSHSLPSAAVQDLTQAAHGGAPDAAPRTWARDSHHTVPTLQGARLRYGILGPPLGPQGGVEVGAASQAPLTQRCSDPGSSAPGGAPLCALPEVKMGLQAPSLGVQSARAPGGPTLHNPRGQGC